MSSPGLFWIRWRRLCKCKSRPSPSTVLLPRLGVTPINSSAVDSAEDEYAGVTLHFVLCSFLFSSQCPLAVYNNRHFVFAVQKRTYVFPETLKDHLLLIRRDGTVEKRVSSRKMFGNRKSPLAIVGPGKFKMLDASSGRCIWSCASQPSPSSPFAPSSS